MTVAEVVKKYDLSKTDKIYEDVTGRVYPLVNLDKLMNLEVKDFYLNLKTNHATITVIGIENI